MTYLGVVSLIVVFDLLFLLSFRPFRDDQAFLSDDWCIGFNTRDIPLSRSVCLVFVALRAI